MPNLSLRRTTALFLLGLALALPWRALAEPHREPAGRPASTTRGSLDLAGRLWSLLTSLWGEEGCYIDPDGLRVAGPVAGAADKADTGCQIDPNGYRAVPPTPLTAPADEGCQIDPDGRCLR